MSEIARLHVSIGTQMDEFKKGMADVQKSLQDTGEKLTDTGKTLSKNVTAPILAAGTGLLMLVKKAGDTVDRLLDLSDMTGMSTRTIQEYQYVARQAGVSTEAVTAAAEGLIKRLPSLADGNSDAAKTFHELTGGMTNANGEMKSSDQIINELIGSLAAIEDPLERNSKGSQIFGGAWKDMAPILSMGAEGINDIRDKAHELGIVLDNEALVAADKFRQSTEMLTATLGGAFTRIGAELAPVITEKLVPAIEEKVVPAILAFVDKVVMLINWFDNLDPKWQAVILAAIGFAAALGPALALVGGLISLVGTLATIFAVFTGPIGLVVLAVVALTAAGVALYKNWDTIKEKASQIWGGIVDTIKGAVNSIIGTIEKMINSTINIVNKFIDQINKAIGGLNKVPGVNISLVPTLSNVNIPKLADGGHITGSGTVMVGERGPELLTLPTGATVTPLNKAGNNVTINVHGTDAHETAQQVVRLLRLQGVT